MSWATEDRAKALAFLLEKSTKCSMCGTAGWEWDEDRFAYEAAEQVCRGCQLKDMVNADSDDSPGRQVVLIPRIALTPQYRKKQREQYEEQQRLAREERESQLSPQVGATRTIEVR